MQSFKSVLNEAKNEVQISGRSAVGHTEVVFSKSSKGVLVEVEIASDGAHFYMNKQQGKKLKEFLEKMGY